MPPAVAIGALGAAQLGTSIAGTIGASRRAGAARRQAGSFFEAALSQRPQVNQITPEQSQALAALQQQALNAQTTFTPTFVSPEQEQAQVEQLRQAARRAQSETVSQLREGSARRGLFRSGIAARQEGQALSDLDSNLQNAVANLQLGFTRERANQQARAFQLSQAAQAQRAAQLGAILDEASRRTGQQQQIFGSLLGPSQAALGGAGAAQQAQSQAFGNLGNTLGGLGQQALLLNLLQRQGGISGPSFQSLFAV